jgi:hypothetical protein
MRPGRFSQLGFLGPSEHLQDVIRADSAKLELLRVGRPELANRLAALIDVGLVHREHWVVSAPHFRVRAEVFKGFQLCPWVPDLTSGQCTLGGGVRYGSVDWRIRNQRTGQEMAGSGLLVHLIRDHEFFEGPGSPYRCEPADLCRLLELGRA